MDKELKNLTIRAWKDYELIDSGDGKKLERYGAFKIIRPETQAIWKPKNPGVWHDAQAEFLWTDGKGKWKNDGVPEKWDLSWNDVRFSIKLTSFKHTGVFPEQAANWDWIAKQAISLQKRHNLKVLNLFGYTGIASIVAAKYGAHVTHVDASKQSNIWAQDNARLSELPQESIRYILDDAFKFVEREVRRGAEYDGIILDPPAFGRGAKGEVWHIEDGLPKLLVTVSQLLSKKPGSFFILNGYAAGYSAQSFLQAVQSAFGKIKTEFGELQIAESDGERCVPSGIYVRFAR